MLGVRGLPECPLCTPLLRTTTARVQSSEEGAPSLGTGSTQRERPGWDAPALRPHNALCFQSGPRGAPPALLCQGCPFPLSLTPGGQGAGASLSKDLITSEHWANLHGLRAQPRRSAQSHNGFPLNNRLSGVTPEMGQEVGREGEGRG